MCVGDRHGAAWANLPRWLLLSGSILLSLTTAPSASAQMTLEQAWLQLPQYEYGQDMSASAGN